MFWLFAVLVLRFFRVVKDACQQVVVCGLRSAKSDTVRLLSESVGSLMVLANLSRELARICGSLVRSPCFLLPAYCGPFHRL